MGNNVVIIRDNKSPISLNVPLVLFVLLILPAMFYVVFLY